MATTTTVPVTSVDDPYGDFFSAAYEGQWTDGLPVIPPTTERVERFLAYARDRDPDEVVALVPPRQGPATLRTIAANAVMAGCLPEYFPVVLAAFDAITDPLFPLRNLGNMRPETPFFLVNGPVRNAIEMNCGSGCLGPGRRANSTIGRALRLAMINLGGLAPGGDYARASFSSPLQYTFCSGEDEENSPWEPFHVEHGFAPGESVLTAFRATSYIAVLAPLDYDQSPLGLLEHMGRSMVSLGNTALYGGNLSCLLLMNPERVRLLAQSGISKAQAKAILYEHMLLPVSYFRKTDVEAMEKKGRVAGGKVSPVDGPDDIYIAVMGGPGGHAVFIPGFSHQTIPHVHVSKIIRS